MFALQKCVVTPEKKQARAEGKEYVNNVLRRLGIASTRCGCVAKKRCCTATDELILWPDVTDYLCRRV